MKPVLAMLEGKWFPKKHVSVRDLFTPLFSVWTSEPSSSYHYEQFTNEAAFRAAIRYAFQTGRAPSIYIGAHGSKTGIHGFHDESIERTVVKNALNLTKGTTKRGVYFGSCSFMHLETAKFILPKCKRVEWLAGYDSDTDWIDSGVLDLSFFRHFLFPRPPRKSAALNTTQRRLRYAVERIQEDMGPLAERLGFHVYVRRQGGGIIDLLNQDDS